MVLITQSGTIVWSGHQLSFDFEHLEWLDFLGRVGFDLNIPLWRVHFSVEQIGEPLQEHWCVLTLYMKIVLLRELLEKLVLNIRDFDSTSVCL